MMSAIRLRAKSPFGEKEELLVLPLSRLVAVQWVQWEESGGKLHLHFDKLFLTAPDPDGALLEEVSRALGIPSGTYAIGGLWAYEWVE